jgi:hypothetical protein
VRVVEQRLIGVGEIARLLGVSKQRASVLCNRKGFPDPVKKVAPLDDSTVVLMRQLFAAQKRRTVTFDQALAALENGAYTIGAGKKLWRQAAVEKWAKENGRHLDR